MFTSTQLSREAIVLWPAVLLLTAGAAAQCVTPVDGMSITTDTVFCPGSYDLPAGIVVAADGVTVSGQGTLLCGADTGNGVSVAGYNNVTVRNLWVGHYYNGLHFSTCDDVLIEDCTVFDTYNDCAVQPCWFLDIFDDPEGPGNSYGHAIWLRYCNRATVRGNDVRGQQNGISLFNCEAVLVENNDASDNTGWGITLYATNNSVIQQNVADDCIRIGSGHLGGDAAALLMVMGSSDNQILDNSFLRGGDGLFLAGYRVLQLPCANNYFARNDCSGSPNNGFEATFSYGNIFEDNISDQCNYGYWLGYSWLTEVRGGQINGCFTAGVAIEHGNHNAIEDNEMLGNNIGIQLWTDPDTDLVAVFPDLKDSYAYVITGNHITQSISGIWCDASGTDRFSYDYTITDNAIDENMYGIRFGHSDASTLSRNFIRNNTVRGLWLTSSFDSTIYDNYVHNATNASADATNSWNIAETAGPSIVGGPSLGGNFWSDYTGVDTDGDGLGDTLVPHTCGGLITVGGDNLPLIWTDVDCNLNGIADATEPDCDGSGIPDECEIASGDSFDCNHNGVPDGCDISSGASPDSNADGIPDECQDCNGNSIPDPVDIATGFSQDCNGNGLPDECDLGAGYSWDCNQNGVPDECDIAAGTSSDCNSNLLPDECEGATSGGWLGTYYDNINFTGAVRSRIDPAIDFVFGVWGPWPDFGRDTFSVRWQGVVYTDEAGTYNFYTFTDDGARLWVNGRQIVDRWVDQGPTEAAGSIELHAHTYYPVVMEYYEQGGGAAAMLFWQPPDEPKALVPFGSVVPDRDCDGDGVLDRCEVAAEAADCNANGVPDACDIASGASQDLDGDGIPDECADCNGNGVPDWQDIASGTSEDCNANGVPDECEEDCNDNGRPDDCDLVAQLEFADPDQYASVPAGPWIDLGDLNGDGAAELAVANSSTSAALRVLWNDGTGAFPSQTSVGTAASQHGVEIADLTGDSLPDLAVIENTNRRLRILQNNGSGSFTQIYTTTFGADPVCVKAADLDHDSDLDLVIGHWGAFISVLRNNGAGTFAAAQTYSTAPVGYVVALGDLDGDNDVDIAVANLTNILILRNNGSGAFGTATTYAAGGSAACVVLADFDADGDLDVAAANESHNTVSILINDGSGVFAAPVNYPVGPNSRFLTAGDFDRDGGIDVVTSNNAAGYLSVLPNNGDGTFAAALQVQIPSSSNALVSGQLNDGGDDIAALMGSAGLAVLLNESLLPSPDCNGNGVPDECDIASGTSTDFNENGVPDECDCAALARADCNCDGAVNAFDIDPFVMALTSPAAWRATYSCEFFCVNDCNGDGAVNAFDIDPFVELLTR